MNRLPRQLKDIMESSTDADNMCADIVRYFSRDDSFNDVLSDEATQEYEIFNLSVKYLDDDYKDDRRDIAEKLKTLISNSSTE